MVSAAFKFYLQALDYFLLTNIRFFKPAINLIYNELNDFKENNDLEKIKKVSNIFNLKYHLMKVFHYKMLILNIKTQINIFSRI